MWILQDEILRTSSISLLPPIFCTELAQQHAVTLAEIVTLRNLKRLNLYPQFEEDEDPSGLAFEFERSKAFSAEVLARNPSLVAVEWVCSDFTSSTEPLAGDYDYRLTRFTRDGKATIDGRIRGDWMRPE